MQPLPPIVVNVPPTSGLPWWATALIAFGSAVLAILVTAWVARGREYQKWAWEKRMDTYIDLMRVSAEVYAIFASRYPLERKKEPGDVTARTKIIVSALTDPRLELNLLTSQEVGRLVGVATEGAFLFIASQLPDGNPKIDPDQEVQKLLRAANDMRLQIKEEMRKPPKLGRFSVWLEARRRRPDVP